MPESKEKLKMLTQQITNIPTMPPVIPHLLGTLRDPSATAGDVEKILLNAPSLTARVLKLVNSAYYGLNRRIESVRDAVVYLGFDTVKNLAMGASVIQVTSNKVDGGNTPEVEFDLAGLWRKAIATGVAAESTAKRLRYENSSDCLVAGLLHILGTIILRIYFPEDLQEAIQYAHENGCSLLEAEKEIIGVPDPEIAGWLGKKWDLPKDIVRGLSSYHKPLSLPEEQNKTPVMVHMGVKIVRMQNIGWTGDEIETSLDPAVLEELGLEENYLETILQEFDEELEKADEFMKMAEELTS